MNEITKYIDAYIGTVTHSLNVKPLIKIDESTEGYEINIYGDDLSFLIGRRGDSLDAFQYLMSLAVFNKFGDWHDILVDINDYKVKRKERLEEIAKNYIDKVRFFNEEVHLPPMSSFERKQIHEFVAGYTDVESISEGDGYERHLVLKPAL